MKQIIFTLLLIFGSILLGSAQQLYVKTGPNLSRFQYENSQGQRLENLQSVGKVHFGIGNRYLMNDGSLYFTCVASWNNYGTIGSDPRLDNFFEWDVSYAGLQAGLDITFFQMDDFTAAFSGSLGAEYLISGTQTINNQAFDIRNSDEYNPLNFMAWGGILSSYALSKKTAICFQYQFGYSLFNLQNSGNDNEFLKLSAHQFSIGLLINLTNIYCPF